MLRLNAQTKGVDVDNARCSCKGYSTGLLPVISRTAFRWESALCIFAFGREAALPEKLNLLVRLFAEKVEFYFILFGG